jgi:hypothetical protein
MTSETFWASWMPNSRQQVKSKSLYFYQMIKNITNSKQMFISHVSLIIVFSALVGKRKLVNEKSTALRS